MNQKNNVAVVHLIWLPYGVSYFKRFIKSYIDSDAGCSHDLILVFNGLAQSSENKPQEYIDYINNAGLTNYSVLYFNKGQDIDIYINVAVETKYEYLLYLNTFSEILANNWLANYVSHFHQDTGMISATGSMQSYYSSVFQKHSAKWETNKGVSYNLKKYKLFIKAYCYWIFLFKPFPNIHARTNAFMIKRDEFLEMGVRPINSKFKAYIFENGRKSITNYYLKKGKKVLIIDKSGKSYEPFNWAESFTFWRGNQENLLISDNQTMIYDLASKEQKFKMTKLAWGINE